MPSDLYDDAEFVKLRDLAHTLEVDVARLQEKDSAAKEALTLANKALDSYKQANNEWRASLEDAHDEINKYMLTETADARFDKEAGQRGALTDRVFSLEKNRNEQSGRNSGIEKAWGVVGFVIGAAISFATMWALLHK